MSSTLARIGFCRTAPLGGRTYECHSCKSQVSIYNSCSDRHCPQCSGARRGDWLDKAAELLIPGVTYFQVVFTLPDKLSPLILGNRRVLYRALMQAAAQSLRQRVQSERGMQSAALMVLHTWNQRLEHHPHVHALVPGSGPSRDGQRWIDCQLTRGTRSKPAKPFLVDNKVLGQEFRKCYLRKLNSLHRSGKLKLEGQLAPLQDAMAWKTFTESLGAHDWCVFIEPPPTSESTPGHVLKYLARYMTGGPISDRRLVSCENDIVTFMARSKDKTKSKQQVPEKLSAVEFTRRWSLHILPKGFTKTRCYGGYSSRYRKNFIALCQQLSPGSADGQSPDPATEQEPAQPREVNLIIDDRVPTCPHCQQTMNPISDRPRPSWRDLFYRPLHPAWFES